MTATGMKLSGESLMVFFNHDTKKYAISSPTKYETIRKNKGGCSAGAGGVSPRADAPNFSSAVISGVRGRKNEFFRVLLFTSGNYYGKMRVLGKIDNK